MENPDPTRPDPLLAASDRFPERHIGPRREDVDLMLAQLGVASLEALVEAVVPAAIRRKNPLELHGLPPQALSEGDVKKLLDLKMQEHGSRLDSVTGAIWTTLKVAAFVVLAFLLIPVIWSRANHKKIKEVLEK